jgi:hypothetical protein
MAIQVRVQTSRAGSPKQVRFSTRVAGAVQRLAEAVLSGIALAYFGLLGDDVRSAAVNQHYDEVVEMSVTAPDPRRKQVRS